MTRQIDSDFLHRALKHYYGYDSFRPGQEEIISQILHGHPVLAVLPTGAGKSVCFQLPSLLLKGVTLVISPLISLMKDQAEQLTARGIPAAYLDSSMTANEYGKVLHAALNKECKFLYVAPERLLNPQFVRFAQQAYITMVAVDEAHCVSQWGHSFRKDYYNIPEFMKLLPTKPLLAAFTATATPQVREDICVRLEMDNAKMVITGFDRPNLHFAVERTRDKERSLLNFMEEHRNSCGVIYCATRKKVEQVTTLLLRQGYTALRYHAGLTPEERRENQNLFVSGQVPVIVATNAFGMGIDKADVRFVLHYNMPKDMESYYQEAGRAGRDGLPAECLLLYDRADIAVNTYLIGHDQPDLEWKEHELELLDKMVFYCNTGTCLRKALLEYFGEKAPARCGNCGNCDHNKTASWRKFFGI
ncbi:RecQ family ATP-dependent DNA helicase [Phascolarctobacterium sp.]|uniref:RecQ family ATP-dependent DNA helicase n=1 Tax=Phascolarctobacterium sp. TaxID=2049039 RepID=UPI00386379E4